MPSQEPQLEDTPLEYCRSCRDELENTVGFQAASQMKAHRADVIVWGKLFPKEALGPRCLGHYYKETGSQQVKGYAVFDLRGLARV